MIYLYAEVLANIRQANVYACLPSNKNDGTKIDVGADKKSVKVSHDGEVASVCLPAGFSASTRLNLLSNQSKEVTIRLELLDSESTDSTDHLVGHDSPWPAKVLTMQSKIRCVRCAQILLVEGDLNEFRDLPSQHWAEMMELWHCHRPYVEGSTPVKDTEATAGAKGYGFAAKIKAREKVIYVDHTTFLMHKSSLKNIETLGTQIHCYGCRGLLGVVSTTAEGLSIYKASVAVQASPNATWQASSHESFLAAHFLSLIEMSASRKIVVHSKGVEYGILIWIFNPDVRYVTSKRPQEGIRAVKIFYQKIDDPQRLLDQQISLEDSELPSPLFEQFQIVLADNTSLLPRMARNFREWTVGLLERYEERD